jgi:hypothetical protein
MEFNIDLILLYINNKILLFIFNNFINIEIKINIVLKKYYFKFKKYNSKYKFINEKSYIYLI